MFRLFKVPWVYAKPPDDIVEGRVRETAEGLSK